MIWGLWVLLQYYIMGVGDEDGGVVLVETQASGESTESRRPAGHPSCFPSGDLSDNARLEKGARSKPIPIHDPPHSVIPRVAPLFFRSINKHGSNVILKEAPRLYSPQIRLNRRTCKTVKLGGITCPKGVSVIMAISSFTMIQNSWATMPKNSIQKGLQVGCRRHQRIRSPSFLFSWGSRVCMGAELRDEPEHDSATCSPAPCPLISLRPHGAQIHYDIPGISPSRGISS